MELEQVAAPTPGVKISENGLKSGRTEASGQARRGEDRVALVQRLREVMKTMPTDVP